MWEIKALSLSKTYLVNMQNEIDQLLKKYEFSEGLGKFKGHKADFKVENKCKQLFISRARFFMLCAPKLKPS